MRKFRFPGSRRTTTSTQMMLAPTMQAAVIKRISGALSRPSWAVGASHVPAPLTRHMIHPRVSLSTPLDAMIASSTPVAALTQSLTIRCLSDVVLWRAPTEPIRRGERVWRSQRSG